MVKAVKFLSVLLAAAFIAPPALAQSLRDLRAQDADNKALAREAAYTSEICGRTIAASIDWSAAAQWPADQSLADACDSALGALETVCRAGRKELVTKFVCAGDGAGPSLAGKTLRFGASPGESGFAATKALLDAAN